MYVCICNNINEDHIYNYFLENGYEATCFWLLKTIQDSQKCMTCTQDLNKESFYPLLDQIIRKKQ